MAFTLTCHICGQKLTLFDSGIKRRKGRIRCTRCGAPVNYDLDSRKIQKSGFWATKEPAFDQSAKSRLISQIKKENQPKYSENTNRFFQKPTGFEKFDLKTGTIIKTGKENFKTSLHQKPATVSQKYNHPILVPPKQVQKSFHKNPAVSPVIRTSKISAIWNRIKTFFAI